MSVYKHTDVYVYNISELSLLTGLEAMTSRSPSSIKHIKCPDLDF